MDVLWNLQPIPAEVNNYKRAKHPKDYFQSDEGRKYVDHCDFLPPLDSDRWQDERAFIRYRYCKMRRDLLLRYGLKLHRIRSENKA